MGRKKQPEEPAQDNFTILYVALMILLMAFFIVLNSMAVISEDNKKKAIDSLIGTFGVPSGKQLFQLISSSVMEEVQGKTTVPPDSLGQAYVPKILDKIKKYALAEYVDYSVSGMNIEISIDSKVTFHAGDDKLLEDVYPVLDAIAEKALDTNSAILIEGHTDSGAIHSEQFPSNWELSNFRADAVLQYFLSKHNIAPIKLAAFGYSDSRPLAPNDSPANREKNRRVQIILLGAGAKSEPTGLKSWWEKIGLLNPFSKLGKE